MLHEIRTCTLIPGKTAEYLRLAEDVSLPIRRNDCGTLVGWWSSDIGTLNQLVHIWSWNDLAERQRQRTLLRSKPEWTHGYNPRVDALVYRREVSIINPVLPIRPPAGPGNVYELRTDRMLPGKVAPWLELFQRILAVREKDSHNVGLWQTEIGEQTEVIDLWAYRDLSERTEVQARALEDPDWKEFLVETQPLLFHQSSVILVPAPFSPLS